MNHSHSQDGVRFPWKGSGSSATKIHLNDSRPVALSLRNGSGLRSFRPHREVSDRHSSGSDSGSVLESLNPCAFWRTGHLSGTKVGGRYSAEINTTVPKQRITLLICNLSFCYCSIIQQMLMRRCRRGLCMRSMVDSLFSSSTCHSANIAAA